MQVASVLKKMRLQQWYYFKTLFTMAHIDNANMEVVLDSVDKRVTVDMNHILLQPYTVVEVKRALFQMHPSKLPGPDDMSHFFFQKYWHIVGLDVTEAILLVLNSGHMLHKMNYTHIALIPKKKNWSPIPLRVPSHQFGQCDFTYIFQSSC